MIVAYSRSKIFVWAGAGLGGEKPARRTGRFSGSGNNQITRRPAQNTMSAGAEDGETSSVKTMNGLLRHGEIAGMESARNQTRSGSTDVSSTSASGEQMRGVDTDDKFSPWSRRPNRKTIFAKADDGFFRLDAIVIGEQHL